MKINEVRRNAYKQIWKEGKSHQEAFQFAIENSNESPEEIAIALKSIPSPKVNMEKKLFWMIHILILLVVIALRVYALATTPSEELSNLGYLIPLLLFSIVLPIYGIYGARKGMMFPYGWVGLSMIVNLILLFAQEQFVPNAIIYVTAIAYVLGVLSAGLVPRLLRMKYTKHVEEFESNGKTKKRQVFKFEE